MDETTGTACLIISNLPAGALCGIDLLSFTTSPRFRGIRQLPPGWHVVFTGASDTFSSRQGSWFFVEPKSTSSPQVFVKKWNPDNEELEPEMDVTALLSWRANLGEIWREGLTPYRQTAPKVGSDNERDLVEETLDWEHLTDGLSEALLTRITGTASLKNHWVLTSASSGRQDVENIPGLSREESTVRAEEELGFLPIDLKHTWREGAVGRERTLAARDRSWALQNLIDKYCSDPMDVIGELQFCFLMVLTLNNYSCLEQWRRILNLLFTCQGAVSKNPTFFIKIVSTLNLQLKHCQDAEGGLFDLSDVGGSLLKSLLKKFREGLQPLFFVEKADVLDELDDLEEYLKTEHGWVINQTIVRQGMLRLEDGEEVWMEMNRVEDEDESGDYLPVIVSLTAEQAEELGRTQTALEASSSNSSHTRKQIGAANSGEHHHGERGVAEEVEEEEMEPEDLDARY